MKKHEGTLDMATIYVWLNPEGMTLDEKYNRARLLDQYAAVTAEVYDHFLDVLPPMHFTSTGFAICEGCTQDLRLAFFRRRTAAGEIEHFAAYISDDDPARSMMATRAMVFGQPRGLQ